MIRIHFSYRLVGLICWSVALSGLMHARPPGSLPSLTPRPSALSDVSSPLLSLDGIWLFRPELSDADTVAGQTVGWSSITVPAEWAMQSYRVTPGTYAEYRRTFNVPAAWAGKKIKLRFDGVHSVCQARINGRKVGEHEGGFTVFEFDVTNQIKPGNNEITVAVKSESTADTLASASQYAAHQLGGITRKVTLFAVPEVYVSTLVTNTQWDNQFRHANLIVDLDVMNESGQAAGPSEIAFELADPSGRQAAMAPATAAIGPLPAGQVKHHSISIRVLNAMKWDPEHPRLYSLKVLLRQQGRTFETLTQRIGFRQVAVKGNRVFVNGHPIKLHGVNRHEVHPAMGRSLIPELWRTDAELFRAANVNYIRTSHYPPAEEFLDACDELGIFVECEAALCWVQHGANEKWKDWVYRDKRFLPYLLRANLENVAANRHHPSIIIWSLANESYWSPSFARVLEAVRHADPSRLTSFHDQCWGEYNNGGSKAQVAVYHYPDEKSPERCNKETRPVLFGEYTHVECYNRSEGVTDPGIRDNWGGPFERMYNLVYRNPGCLGGAIWAGIDEIFSLPGGHVCGYGPWGIIDGWRRQKPEYWHVKKSYAPIRVVDPKSPHPFRAGVIRVPLENRYDFTDLSEVGIEWKIGAEQGRATVAAGPHKQAILTIHPTQQPKSGEKLRLTFTDPRGFVCETEELSTERNPTLVRAPESHAPEAALDSTNSRYVVKGREFVCEIDKSTGKIVQAEVKGKRVLEGGPELMILPLQSGACAPDYRTDFPPLNSTCTAWQQKSIQALVKNGVVSIESIGMYAEAEMRWGLSIFGDGGITVHYTFSAQQDVDPRQYGVVFFTPLDIDSLSWQRSGQWNLYPPGHIGRLSGSAVAHPLPRGFADLLQVPRGEWSTDANELGTNDFRSTKTNVTDASLLSANGGGITVSAPDHHAIRAFVGDRKNGLLIAGFNTGGADPFFAPHYAGERRPLKKGETVVDWFVIHLIHK